MASLQIRGMLKYWYFPTIVLISILEKKYIKYLIYAFLAGMLINLMISYSIYFYHIKTFLGEALTIRSLVPFQASHMEYSEFVSLYIFLYFYYAYNTKYMFLKIFLLIISILMLILLFLLLGRTGQLGFILTAFLVSLIYLRNNYKLLFSSIILIFAILTSSYYFSKTFHNRVNSTYNQLKNFKNNSELGVRLSSYLIIPDLIETTNTIIGSGLGDSRKITHKITIEKYGQNSYFKWQKGKLHQTFLTIFHALGLIGFLLFIFTYISLIKTQIKSKDIIFIKYIFSISILIPLMSNELFGQREIMLLFALFASIIIYTNIEEDKILNHKK
jgi:O-antigen ligase